LELHGIAFPQFGYPRLGPPKNASKFSGNASAYPVAPWNLLSFPVKILRLLPSSHHQSRICRLSLNVLSRFAANVARDYHSIGSLISSFVHQPSES
jgi:hypothetical protein